MDFAQNCDFSSLQQSRGESTRWGGQMVVKMRFEILSDEIELIPFNEVAMPCPEVADAPSEEKEASEASEVTVWPRCSGTLFTTSDASPSAL